LGALLLIAFVWAIYRFVPGGSNNDWELSFRPALLRMASGVTPYVPGKEQVLNPPWILAPLIPLAVLPEKLGWALLLVINLISYGFVAYRLGAKPIATLFLLISAAFLLLLFQGQIDGFIILGFILPKPIGLFLLLGKPQIGLGVAIFWFIEVFRDKGSRGILWTFLPVCLAYLLSFAIYGPYVFMGHSVVGQYWDYSIWPISIPIGLLLLKYAITQRQINFAILTGPFLSPYVGFHSYAAALLGLVNVPIDILLASLGTWIIFLLGGK
ncbi:MAG: hypothetical protein PHQ40_11695, partial [Anaerolineaceae bacterium]|nr:hypothetical protein [Anaerolineaceae bacterium]